MQGTAIYGLGEFYKVVTHVTVTGGVTTTYIGMAPYHHTEPNKQFKSNADFAHPIFKIKKITESVSGTTTTTTTFVPEGSFECEFIRDDGSQNFLSYNYI